MKAVPAWLHEYNYHRPHTAIGNVWPVTRLTNPRVLELRAYRNR